MTTEKSNIVNSIPVDTAEAGPIDSEAVGGVRGRPLNFLHHLIRQDIEAGTFDGRVHTRFPPEPNGYLHIGHAKAICINFGMAQHFPEAKTNLRFDDTNPTKEDVEYVDAIQEDIRWLGFDWGDRLYYASDYFDQLFEYAVKLIKDGKAYVCHLSQDEIRDYRGTLTEKGKDSPYRSRMIEENLDLFLRMKAGEFKEGHCVLRARIDMISPNLNLRDPVLYRILHAHHHRTGDKWCIYPTYDFAHGQSDSIERITHSMCSLEFANHRPLYDWLTENLEIYRPKQIEFSRLKLTYTMTSKRKLLLLVEQKLVMGWNDPRMPTLSGLRRRGYTPASICEFCDRIGVSRESGVVEIALLEDCIRDDLNKNAPRVMAVLRPLKMVIENYPEGDVEELEAQNHPEKPEMGKRNVLFSKVIYIDRDDFMEEPPKKFFRLAPGREVRLRYGYYVTCTGVIKDPASGEIIEIRCTYDPLTRGGWAPDGRKVKGTIHWVSEVGSVAAEVRLLDQLFSHPDPEDVPEGMEFTVNLNPNSLTILTGARVERGLEQASAGDRFQFERSGYYCVDSMDSRADHLVFNRVVGLKDTWAKASSQV